MTFTPPFDPNTRPGGLFGLGGLAPQTALRPSSPIDISTLLALRDVHTDRRVFFSFHFDDVLRVNNVRRRYEFEKDATQHRFYDSSLWEEKKLTNPEAIKGLIRYGVGHTSAVCVLAGTGTWDRRWVRYEIARAVVDNRGLLVVHLNGINHVSGGRDPLGPNPLWFMGVYKTIQSRLNVTSWHLCRLTAKGWVPYEDYTDAVSLPRYLNGNVAPHVAIPLSTGTAEYCYDMHGGAWNIATWINDAARSVGR